MNKVDTEREEARKLASLMSEEVFKSTLEEKKGEYLSNIVNDLNKGILHIFNFNGADKFKSVRRAIKRGKVDIVTGVIYPKRPFNNRKPTLGRRFNESRKEIYGRLTNKEI